MCYSILYLPLRQKKMTGFTSQPGTGLPVNPGKLSPVSQVLCYQAPVNQALGSKSPVIQSPVNLAPPGNYGITRHQSPGTSHCHRGSCHYAGLLVTGYQSLVSGQVKSIGTGHQMTVQVSPVSTRVVSARIRI